MQNFPVASQNLDRLNETLQRAFCSSPYYRERFRGLDTVLKSVEDLRTLPLLKRETLVMRGYDMLSAGSVPITVSMSGGTTSAPELGLRPVLTFHDAEEARARRALLEASYGEMDPRPLLLHLVNLGHGYDTSTALEGAFQMALERPFHFEAILSLLRREFAFPGFTTRIEAIVGALRLLKALTLLLIERGIDGSEFDVKVVSSSSNHLTSRWRALLGDYWHADVDETYGLSEVPGLHARRCLACGHFHFSPLAVVEVLRLDDDEPIEQGIGRLVATSLFPFASMQPIIRYDTGDAIEIVGRCTYSELLGFEFLGRLSDVVTLPSREGSRVLLSSIAVNEILDAFHDEIAVEPFTFARSLELQTTVGFQKWTLRPLSSSRRLALAVELRHSPRKHLTATLERSLRERIIAAAPELRVAVAAGEIDFQIEMHEPGTSNLKALV